MPKILKIQLLSADGHRPSAWRCDPNQPARAGVVILHAVYGLTDRMAAVCKIWADAGFIAVAPALFDRLAPGLVHSYTRAGADAGIQSFAALTQDQIFADIDAASATINLPNATVISGFCSGGSWAWRAAARCDATYLAQVNFYGSHIPALIDLEPRCPTILHYGDQDAIVSRSEIDRIRVRHPNVQTHVYANTGHAFENPDQPTFNRAAADAAWRASIAFVSRILAERA